MKKKKKMKKDDKKKKGKNKKGKKGRKGKKGTKPGPCCNTNVNTVKKVLKALKPIMTTKLPTGKSMKEMILENLPNDYLKKSCKLCTGGEMMKGLLVTADKPIQIRTQTKDNLPLIHKKGSAAVSHKNDATFYATIIRAKKPGCNGKDACLQKCVMAMVTRAATCDTCSCPLVQNMKTGALGHTCLPDSKTWLKIIRKAMAPTCSDYKCKNKKTHVYTVPHKLWSPTNKDSPYRLTDSTSFADTGMDMYLLEGEPDECAGLFNLVESVAGMQFREVYDAASLLAHRRLCLR